MDILKLIKEEVWQGATEKQVNIGNRVYVLKTLNDGEIVWRDKFILTSASFSFISSKKAPTIAVSLVSIDGVSVRDLFLKPEELKKEEQTEETVKTWLKLIGFGSVDERFLVAQRVYEFLSSLPPLIIETLYKDYLVLETEQTSTLNTLLKKN